MFFLKLIDVLFVRFTTSPPPMPHWKQRHLNWSCHGRRSNVVVYAVLLCRLVEAPHLLCFVTDFSGFVVLLCRRTEALNLLLRRRRMVLPHRAVEGKRCPTVGGSLNHAFVVLYLSSCWLSVLHAPCSVFTSMGIASPCFIVELAVLTGLWIVHIMNLINIVS